MKLTAIVKIENLTKPHTTSSTATNTASPTVTIAVIFTGTRHRSSKSTRMRPPSSGYAGSSRLNAISQAFSCIHRARLMYQLRHVLAIYTTPEYIPVHSPQR